MLDASRIADELTRRFGVAITGRATDDANGQHLRLSPLEVPRTQGFTVDLLIAWRSVRVSFVPASFAAPLLAAMAAAAPEQRAACRAFVNTGVADGATVRLRINDAAVDPLASDTWPAEWRGLALEMEKGPLAIPADDPAATNALAQTWAGRVLGGALALMPLEPAGLDGAGEVEGAAHLTASTRYERSRVNRALCIELRGCRCIVCDVDFGAAYGPLGEGFIEVHHLEPVSDMKQPRVLDPAVDLVPVCPNCHAMLHRRTPPLTLEQLKAEMRPINLASEADGPASSYSAARRKSAP